MNSFIVGSIPTLLKIIISNNFNNKILFFEFRLRYRSVKKYEIAYYINNMWTKPVRLSLKLMCLFLLSVYYFYTIKLTNSFYLTWNVKFFFIGRKKKNKA